MSKIAVINFSGRPKGNCHNIAMIIKQAMTGCEITLKEMYFLSINPCGKCNYECFMKNEGCPYANDDIISIYNTICSSDLAIYIVPNYVEYPNANFFIFQERGACFFLNNSTDLQEKYKAIDLADTYQQVKKKFVVVSNTGKENFKQVFKNLIKHNTNPDILFLAASEYDRSAILGDIMESVQARQAVEDFVRG